MNKFEIENQLSRLPIKIQRFIMNQYFYFLKSNQTDVIRYNETINNFKKKSCIFIHIPKTAGISLSKSFFGVNVDTNHLSIRRYRLVFSKSDFNKFFKFTFVRNPWDKLFSCYRYLKMGGHSNYHMQWKNTVLDTYDDFNSFVEGWLNEKNIHTFSHFLPQSWFLTDYKNNILTDYIGRFENLEHDYKEICSVLNTNTELEHFNKSDKVKKNYYEYYNDKSIDIVYKLYKKDIKLFKYDFK
tara:strand:- start:127 stop:849 length:723 start_codon:yes stop_codon:yes gene_type:complete